MSKQKISTTKKGFTIIEVVLVLAIAGLIFLMVFVALPALQRNQRDTQRKDDYATLQSLIISKYSENGTVPTGAAVTNLDDGIGKRGADGHGHDPQDNVYDISTAAATGTINLSSAPYNTATMAGR
ncbi:prepilin-type N-terminal cleavage/methylation domain-containing protein, partial [Candidatus Saccharibacteria bacterium]|nr:prepilin-type N-terminal cleavage/methylation domain-containing protein [Candidatus Saccharibacteria bacterium]